MAVRRPRVFVGSSREGIQFAEVIAGHLQIDFDVHPWNRGLFVPGHYTLEDLDSAIRRCDFAILVGTGDDVLTKRNESALALRDNVVFELGLFMGTLGRRRSILVVPSDVELALPSDLCGLTRETYSPLPNGTVDQTAIGILQEMTRRLSIVLLHEWAQIVKTEDERHRALLRERRLKAVVSLYKAVTTLRDLFIEAPGTLLGGVEGVDKFEAAKRTICSKVRRHYESWEADARRLDVLRHLEALTSATESAILAFPYPLPTVSTADIRALGESMAWQAKATSEGGLGGKIGAAMNELNAEFSRRVQSIADGYSKWWRDKGGEVRRIADEFQDVLMETTVRVGFEANSLHGSSQPHSDQEAEVT